MRSFGRLGTAEGAAIAAAFAAALMGCATLVGCGALMGCGSTRGGAFAPVTVGGSTPPGGTGTGGTGTGGTGTGGTGTGGTGTGGGGTAAPGAANVYVIQDPMVLGAGAGTILQFSASATGSVTPGRVITAPVNTSFSGLAADGAGNVYVAANSLTASDVREYAAGASGTAAAVRLLPADDVTRIGMVDGLATNAAGEIFVAEDSGGVAAFGATATGSVAPDRYILGAGQKGGGLSTLGVANAIAGDSLGNLFVLNSAGALGVKPILVFGPTATGDVAPIRAIGGTLASTSFVLGVTTDSVGNIYVTNDDGFGLGSIFVFAPDATGNVAPVRMIAGSATQITFLHGIKVDSVGNIYVVSTDAHGLLPTLLKFSATATGNVAPTSSFTSSAWTNTDVGASLAVY